MTFGSKVPFCLARPRRGKRAGQWRMFRTVVSLRGLEITELQFLRIPTDREARIALECLGREAKMYQVHPVPKALR